MARGTTPKRDPALIPFSHDHRRALGLCVRLARWKPEREEPPSLLAQEIRFQAAEILIPHFTLEEEILFPAVAPSLKPHRALLQKLVDEHGGFRDALERMAGPMAEADLVALLKRFGRTLEAHVRQEERELFPLIESAVPARTRAALRRRIGTVADPGAAGSGRAST
jgi:iron-sulfur cluster repair protein YtfE (RIC family)